MGFPALFSKKKEKKDYFGLFLKNSSAEGFVFVKEDTNVSIIAQESTPYTNGWEQVLEDADKLVSDLEEKVNKPLDEVIFFLPSYCIDSTTNEIKKQYKDIIKNIVKTLELKPLGFIELHEAIKNGMQKKNEAPLNAIFVELDSSHESIYGYKGGKEILRHQSARSENLIDDLTETFKAVESGLLPSKIFLYGEGDLNEQAIALESAHWDSKMFLHPPKVEIIKPEEMVENFRDVFAEQLLSEEPMVGSQDTSEQQVDNNQDHQEVMGFVVGEDIRDVQPTPPAEDILEEPSSSKFPKLGFALPKFNLPFKFSMPKQNGVVIIIALVLVTIIGILVAFEYFLHKMNVTVYLPGQELKKTIELSAPISKSENNNFYVKLSEVSKTFTDETKTTGEQEVGQKAKGSITIQSLDNEEKTISKGTDILFGDLTYILDQDVKIASRSGFSNPSEAKGSVTASKIGPEYNIEKGKEMKIDGLSNVIYIAVSNEAFGGGTRKKVKTVSKTDATKLQASVSTKAKAAGADELKNIGSGQQVLGDLTKVDIADSEYTKEIGEEGDVLGLKAKANIEYYTYPADQFKEALVSSLSADAPKGYKIEASKLHYKVKKAKKTNDTVTLSVETEVNIVKDIPQEEISKSISAKMSSQLNDILKKNFDAQEYSIDKTAPTEVLFGNWTPLFSKNIGVTISSK